MSLEERVGQQLLKEASLHIIPAEAAEACMLEMEVEVGLLREEMEALVFLLSPKTPNLLDMATKNTDNLKTLVINKFNGNLSRFRDGDINSGMANFFTSWGYNTFIYSGTLTFNQAPYLYPAIQPIK